MTRYLTALLTMMGGMMPSPHHVHLSSVRGERYEVDLRGALHRPIFASGRLHPAALDDLARRRRRARQTHPGKRGRR